MKKLLVALAIANTCMTSHAFAENEKHFRHIMFRETPFAPYRGIYPINEQKSEAVTHYEFKYDDKQRVTQITRKIDDHVIDSMGVWDSFIWFAPQVKISYLPGKEVHTYFNTKGEQISAHGAVWQAIYQLGTSGNRQSLEFFDKAGKAVESEWHVHRYEWRPSEDGHVFEKRFNLAGEQVTLRPEFKFHEVKLEYDNDGKLVFVRNFGTKHQPINNDSGAGIDRITYDLNGNFIRWQVYGKDGNPVEGNRPRVHLGEHLYDSKGNKIGLRGFDRFGKQIAFSWGALSHVYRYNEQGIQTETKSYKADGSFQEHFVYTFSEQGTRRTSLTALDADGNPTNDPRLKGAAKVTYQYDEQGRAEPSFFDYKGKELAVESE
ncbi:hypothetical protein HII17_16305 [Thalassotalea sp. M1531]|uniref:Uncharacterized protein n=1 Tax=Thalassotalea algicola TaxID=2716224 RepID=A0A7Y0Q8P5_9GAMM|nr:hypothetical protein [Thalassotalea algicola]NMP33122.1 hypothetical protein [Thalassotalea algicola]